MDPICHIGTVKSISSDIVQVSISQTSACDACRAKKFCTSADVREKTIDVKAGGYTFAVGDRVVLTGRGSMGLKAVWMAYVLPLFLMMVVMFVLAGWLMPGKEAVAAFSALGALIVYYVALAFWRNQVRQEFTFSVRPATDSDIGND